VLLSAEVLCTRGRRGEPAGFVVLWVHAKDGCGGAGGEMASRGGPSAALPCKKKNQNLENLVQ